jgi:hypothetical protein
VAVYLRSPGEERVLLDTAKAKLDYEGVRYELTNAMLALYDVSWFVGDGTWGSDEQPCKVLRLTDPFTGLMIEVPFDPETASQLAGALEGKKRRFKRSNGSRGAA